MVRPAFGIRVKVLPVGYRRVVVGPTNYYYYYGTYYVQRNEEYEVVEAPLNAEIGSLPDGYNTINVDGEEYYELDGIYYMPSVNENQEEGISGRRKPNEINLPRLNFLLFTFNLYFYKKIRLSMSKIHSCLKSGYVFLQEIKIF